MVDYVRTVKKACKHGKHGSFYHLIFIVFIIDDIITITVIVTFITGIGIIVIIISMTAMYRRTAFLFLQGPVYSSKKFANFSWPCPTLKASIAHDHHHNKVREREGGGCSVS